MPQVPQALRSASRLSGCFPQQGLPKALGWEAVQGPGQSLGSVSAHSPEEEWSAAAAAAKSLQLCLTLCVQTSGQVEKNLNCSYYVTGGSVETSLRVQQGHPVPGDSPNFCKFYIS